MTGDSLDGTMWLGVGMRLMFTIIDPNDDDDDYYYYYYYCCFLRPACCVLQWVVW